MIPPPPETPRATGPHFYRYGSGDYPERLEALMLHNAMYIPSASELNDLRDVRPRLHRPLRPEWVAFMKSLSEKGLALVPPEEHARRIDDIVDSLGIDEMLDIASRMAHDMMTKFRVYSMSKRWDNLSMWEWYASRHRGYCLEFANAEFFHPAREVVYDNSFVMDISDEAHRTANWFFYKSPDWSNEEEVRLVLPARLGGPVFKMPPGLLTRVILGKDVPTADVERFRTWGTRTAPPLPVVTTKWDPFQLRLIVV
jgi:hypothetical protein